MRNLHAETIRERLTDEAACAGYALAFECWGWYGKDVMGAGRTVGVYEFCGRRAGWPHTVVAVISENPALLEDEYYVTDTGSDLDSRCFEVLRDVIVALHGFESACAAGAVEP